MKLLALPAFTDNYIWMLHDGREALVVDPGEAAPVIEALQTHGLRLSGILVTHHHGDHVGGIDALRSVLHGPVYGPAREAIPPPYTPLCDGQRVQWRGLDFEVIDVPGHTAGHIAFWSPGAGEGPLLFCGDTLFSAGCGRLFEGTPAQMSASLARLAALPGSTKVCCAHEYTLSNLRFAQAVEPGNAALAEYVRHCEALRARGQPTLPSTIARERAINPFLRCREPEVVAAARRRQPTADDAVSVLAALREWKNDYR
ncbi:MULTISPECIES: hydroxyacylglutathione hydrolase [Caldimonas]|uniref:hydroxyacylglutathione hydrolase n=1 Tax=Caldimonas TaxID=196013 RepID=UPI00037433AC|nr:MULTISPECIES: hydroxyacylglutathione hydrolase [Caldimonas]MCX7660180.1 hydroxyacylglutathione hydrolase [Caldimonas manganoxidans]GIX25080.1 MAG: hydroxyacylglutathione hydrolase [Caldimonas sp.]